MNSLTSFLNMGGYAQYIWPSYALTAAVLLVLLYTSLRFRRTSRQALDALRAKDGGDSDGTGR